MKMSSNGSCDLLGEVLKHVDGKGDSVAAELVQLTSLLASLLCLLISLLLNTYVIANILSKKKFKVT